MRSLLVPLTQSQVDAACRLHERLAQWKFSDAALTRLREVAPSFDAEACLLKSVVVNSLYGTQVKAIVRMARHITSLMEQTSSESAGPEFVERIAALPVDEESKKKRRFTSFAAKFSHFFIDEERFPIYDEAARNAIMLHLGDDAKSSDDMHPYLTYCSSLEQLRRAADLHCLGRHLDRYLWIVGMYMKWLKLRNKPKQEMNVELRRLFEKPGDNAIAELDALLPSILDRAFKQEL